MFIKKVGRIIIRFEGTCHYICTSCENSEFTIKESVWISPYCPYCGEDGNVKPLTYTRGSIND